MAMNLNDAKEIVRGWIDNKIPGMLWGAPGVGKSSIVAEICMEYNSNKSLFPNGFGLIDLRLPQMDPTDLRGIPVPDKETRLCKWFWPEFLPDPDGKRHPKNGVLFLDEIEKAPPSVKSASLQLILDRRLGEYILPDGWSILAAGNREEDGTFSQPIGAALSNRMCHIEIGVDPIVWIQWAKNNGVIQDVIAYIEYKKEHLYPTNESQGSGTNIKCNAFPTPRSWFVGSTLMKSTKNDRFRYKLLESSIGEHVSNEFKRWDKIYRDVNAEDIVMNGRIPKKLSSGQLDYKYAVAISCAFYVNDMKLWKEKGNAAETTRKSVAKNISELLKIISSDLSVVFFRHINKDITVSLLEYPTLEGYVDKVMESVKEV